MDAGTAAAARVANSMIRLFALVACVGMATELAAQQATELYRRGLASFQRGDVAGAIAELDTVVALDPSLREARIVLAQAYLLADQNELARTLLRGLLATAPDDGHLLHLLGITLLQSGRATEAIAELDRVVRQAPTNRYPLISRAEAYLAIGDLAGARRDADAARQVAPDEVRATLLLARIALTQGRAEDAERLATAAAASDELDPVELALLGAQAAIAAGRPERAVAWLGPHITAGNAPRSDVLYLYSQALLRSGRGEDGAAATRLFEAQRSREQTIRRLQSEAAHAPDSIEPRLELITALIENRQQIAASLVARELMRLAPDDQRVRRLSQEAGVLGDPAPKR